MLVRWHGSRPAAEDAIRRAINDDPYAIDLHRMLGGMEYEDGNKAAVAEEIAVLTTLMHKYKPSIIVNANEATN
jgi:hypothetical protein